MVPTSYLFSVADVVPVNGSFVTGQCSSFTNNGGCADPTSSVLFDGHIPTLTELDGDMWASQLLTVQTTDSGTDIIFDFTDNLNLMRVEVVMFNCPQWGIGPGVQTIQTLYDTVTIADSDAIVSCEHLVRACISSPASSSTFTLRFVLSVIPVSSWVHLGEVTFYTDTSVCPPDTTLTSTTPQVPTSSPATTTTAATPTLTPETTLPEETTTPETTPEDTTTTAETTLPEETTTPETTPEDTTTTAETTTMPETKAQETTTTKTTRATLLGMSSPDTNRSTAAGSETTSETTQMPTFLTIIIAIPVVLLLLLVVVVAAIVLLVCWRYKHQRTVKEEASHTSSQTHTYQHQAINSEEMGNTSEEHVPTSPHTQGLDEAVTFDDQEYSLVTTELPLPDSRKPSESEIPSDHLYDQVDGKSEKKKAHTQQQDFEDEDHLYDEVDKKSNTTVPKSAMEKNNRAQQKFLPSKTALTENHDEDLGSAPEEDRLYAQVNKSGRKKDRTQDTAQSPASQQNWLYQDDGHDMLAVSEQGTSEDHSYDRVEWNVGKEKESATSECQFHNKLEVAGAASKEKVEQLQSEDSEYDQVDMSSNSLAETPEEYFLLRHHEKSVPYLEANIPRSTFGSEHDDMYAQLEENNTKEVPREQTALCTTTERSQDHLYAEPEGEQGTKFPRKHTKPHVKSHHHLYAEMEEKKMRANQTGPPPVTPSQDNLYSRIEERKVQTKSASLLRKSRDDRFAQPEEREARTQPTPSDRPQDHLYAQPDKKKVRAKSSSLLSKSHDNLYAQPEERDVHTPLTSFVSRDRLRKSHDHLYAELEEGKGNKASKDSTSRGSIKSGKPQTHEYAELEESAQPSSLSPQTSRASLKSKKPQAHVYAQLEEGEMHVQPLPLPPEELLYAEPEERRANKTRSIAVHAQLKDKQHAHLYSQVEERDMQTQLSSLPPEELLYAEPEERRATKKRSTLPPLKCGKPHARVYSQVEERDMQTQLSSLPPEELLYAKLEKRKATKKCSTLPPLRGGKPQAHLYAQLEERGASNVRATPPSTPVSSTPSSRLYAQLEERETSGVRVGQSTTSLEAAQSQDDLHTQLEEEDTSDIRSTPPPAM